MNIIYTHEKMTIVIQFMMPNERKQKKTFNLNLNMKKNENDDSTTTTTTTTNLHKHASFFFLLSTYFFKHTHTHMIPCFLFLYTNWLIHVQCSIQFIFNFFFVQFFWLAIEQQQQQPTTRENMAKEAKKNYHLITNTELETIDSIKTKVFFSFLLLQLLSSRAKLLTIGLHWSFLFFIIIIIIMIMIQWFNVRKQNVLNIKITIQLMMIL